MLVAFFLRRAVADTVSRLRGCGGGRSCQGVSGRRGSWSDRLSDCDLSDCDAGSRNQGEGS
jgi:hypothetical protein